VTTTPDLTETALRLHALAIHLLRRLRREDAALGLSAARLSALSVVGFAGPCSLGALAAAEAVAPPTMSRIVNALEHAGLVQRAPDPTDGRSVRIAATEAGRAVLERGRARRTGLLAVWLASLGDEDLAAVGRAVAAIEMLLQHGG
jgi:DNA-binding MarR family transcriptional regulator